MKVFILQLFLLHFWWNWFWILEDKNENTFESWRFVDYCCKWLWRDRKRWWSYSREMKNLKAKYRQDAKALIKIQMGVWREYFAKIATCETAKEDWDFLETEVYGDEKVRTINLQTLRREFQNLKMIESEKIDGYCTRVMNIVMKWEIIVIQFLTNKLWKRF